MTEPCDDPANNHGPMALFLTNAPLGAFDPIEVCERVTPFGLARLLLELADLHSRTPEGHIAGQMAILLEFASPEQRAQVATLSAHLTQLVSVPTPRGAHHH